MAVKGYGMKLAFFSIEASKNCFYRCSVANGPRMFMRLWEIYGCKRMYRMIHNIRNYINHERCKNCKLYEI